MKLCSYMEILILKRMHYVLASFVHCKPKTQVRFCFHLTSGIVTVVFMLHTSKGSGRIVLSVGLLTCVAWLTTRVSCAETSAATGVWKCASPAFQKIFLDLQDFWCCNLNIRGSDSVGGSFWTMETKNKNTNMSFPGLFYDSVKIIFHFKSM